MDPIMKQCVHCYEIYEYYPDEDNTYQIEFCSQKCLEDYEEYEAQLAAHRALYPEDEIPF